MTSEKENYEKIQLVMKDWEASLNTQMHFNDLIMKNRTAGLTIVGVFLSASIGVLAVSKTLSFFVALCGILLLIGFIILDFTYYRKLLLGAVQHTQKLDDFFSKKELQLEVFGQKINLLGLTTKITESVGDKPKEHGNKYKRSFWFLIMYYLPMTALSILIVLYLLLFTKK